MCAHCSIQWVMVQWKEYNVHIVNSIFQSCIQSEFTSAYVPFTLFTNVTSMRQYFKYWHIYGMFTVCLYIVCSLYEYYMLRIPILCGDNIEMTCTFFVLERSQHQINDTTRILSFLIPFKSSFLIYSFGKILKIKFDLSLKYIKFLSKSVLH